MPNYIDIPAFGAASWKGSVANVAALPAIGNTAGDARIVLSPLSFYVWSGSGWNQIGGGGGGGSPGGINGDIQFNNSGAFGGVAFVPVANGGLGQNMTLIIDAANGAHNALACGLVQMQGTVGVVVNGILAPGSSTQWSIHNASSQTIIITHQSSSATAANRIVTPNFTSVTIAPGFMASGYYDTTISRHRLIDINSTLSASSPLFLTGGILSIQTAGAFQAGALTASDWNTFNNKFGGSGTNIQVAWFSSTNSLSSDSGFQYDTSTKQVGIQADVTLNEAALNVISDVGQTIADPSSLGVALVQWIPPAEPSAASTSTSQPDIQIVDGGLSTFTPNTGSSGYNAGDVIDYQITAGYDDGSNPIVWGVSTYEIDGITDPSNPFGIDVSIVQGGSNLPVNNWALVRQINSGGFTDFLITTSANFTDDNSAWTPGSPDLSNTADDYLASGTSRSYLAYGHKTTPHPSEVYSPGNNSYGYADDNNNTAYKVTHHLSGFADDLRVIGSPDGSSGNDHIDSAGDFTESPSSWSPGNLVLPNSYGYVSDGTILNRSYDLYATNSSHTLFSVNAINGTVSDPNDGLTYFVDLFPDPTTGKVILNGASGQNFITTPEFFDDGITPFTDGVGHTPVVSYVTGVQISNHGSGLSDKPALAIKSLDGNYSRIDFMDSSGIVRSRLINEPMKFTIFSNSYSIDLHQSNGLEVNAPAAFNDISFRNGSNMTFNTVTGTKIGTATNQKLAFFNAFPVVQQTGGAATAGASYTTTEQDMLQKVYDALRIFGLLS